MNPKDKLKDFFYNNPQVKKGAVAAALGVSHPFLSMIMSGAKKFPEDRIIKLDEILKKYGQS